MVAGGVFLMILMGFGCAGRSTSGSTASKVSGIDDVGQFVWQDLITDEIEASRRFYGELLGWKFERTERLGEPYYLIRSGGYLVGGIVGAEREEPDQPIAQWLSYVRVDDLEGTIESAGQEGGEVLVKPLVVSRSARAAVIKDSQGAILGLLQTTEKTPHGSNPGPVGEFFWREYLTPNSDDALSFYSGVLGYSGEEREERDGMTYHVLRRGKARAGLIKIRMIPVRPNWLPYVRVEDPAALASKTIALGGEVLLEPHPNARRGSVAIVTDPGGAAVALQKWPFE